VKDAFFWSLSFQSLAGAISFDVVDIPLLAGFYTSQLVQDFFHQRYDT